MENPHPRHPESFFRAMRCLFLIVEWLIYLGAPPEIDFGHYTVKKHLKIKSGDCLWARATAFY
jgi:hypothetical protein